MTLDLSKNEIRTLPNGIFDSTFNLKSLNRSINLLSTFDVELLRNLQMLCFLDLSSNHIRSIDASFSLIGQSIVILRLRSNALEEIEEHTLQNCTYLNELRLDMNKILFMHELALLGGSFITIFSLSYNGLKNETNIRTVLHQISPTEVNIDGNKITKLVSFMFQSFEIGQIKFPIIKEVEASDSKSLMDDIKELYRQINVENNETGLMWLNLSSNEIDLVHRDSFRFLSKLVTLDLSFNRITELGVNVFVDLAALVNLFLSGNKLKRLPRNLFLKNNF